MTQKAVPQMGSNDGSGLPPQEASAALKEGLVSGAHDISAEVKHIAGDVAGEAKKAAESKIGAGKDFAAEQLGAVAYALRHAGEQLRSEESGITEYVEKAASSVDSVSHYLQTRTLSQLIGDVEGYARREPAVFLGGAFFAGLLGGRFLKSATPSRTSTNGGRPGQGQRAQAPSRNGSTPQLGQGTESSKAGNQRPAGQADKGAQQKPASSAPGQSTSGASTSGTSTQGSSSHGASTQGGSSQGTSSQGASSPGGHSGSPTASKNEPPAGTRNGNGNGNGKGPGGS
jgi:hypothetical protein